MSKIKKPISLGIAIGGAVLTITGAALLGVGCNYSAKLDLDKGDYLTFGVGSQNYGRIIGAKIQGKELSKSELDEKRKGFEEHGKELSYNDYVKNNKKEYDKIKKEYDEFKKNNKDTDSEFYKIQDESYKAQLNFVGSVQTGYALMVSGAVLFSIFVLVMAFGITAFFLGKKA